MGGRAPRRQACAIATAAAIVAAAAFVAACGSSRDTALHAPPLSFPLYSNPLGTAFPGGTCGPAVVGKPFTTFVVLTGGDPPYRVTWYVNGRPGGLDRVVVTHTGENTDPIYANGTKYTITFTPRDEADKVSFEALDFRHGKLMEKTEVPVIGAGGPCQIAP